IAAMSLKFVMPSILTYFGYRSVLIANTVMMGLMIILFMTIGASMPIWVIVIMVFCFGFFTSLQFTSMNTLVFADINARQTSNASTIASTLQQMSMSFGVAIASLAAALFIPDPYHSSPQQLIHGVHEAFLALGIMTIVSALIFLRLHEGDGDELSQHKTILSQA
ncbi:MAG: MFS transporter, partial [Pseudomonadota bacterium]|nr:MFS transporter [Pseudomonadota bacterium]